ncbi:hypothetical protein LXA43DRAFT_1099950 [Ganoderma leucocontextum]|nr:hypothetical protein LXA43DRAFT_1099950 [Ganoderma leucocontextum]
MLAVSSTQTLKQSLPAPALCLQGKPLSTFKITDNRSAADRPADQGVWEQQPEADLSGNGGGHTVTEFHIYAYSAPGAPSLLFRSPTQSPPLSRPCFLAVESSPPVDLPPPPAVPSTEALSGYARTSAAYSYRLSCLPCLPAREPRVTSPDVSQMWCVESWYLNLSSFFEDDTPVVQSTTGHAPPIRRCGDAEYGPHKKPPNRSKFRAYSTVTLGNAMEVRRRIACPGRRGLERAMEHPTHKLSSDGFADRVEHLAVTLAARLLDSTAETLRHDEPGHIGAGSAPQARDGRFGGQRR